MAPSARQTVVFIKTLSRRQFKHVLIMWLDLFYVSCLGSLLIILQIIYVDWSKGSGTEIIGSSKIKLERNLNYLQVAEI